MSQNHPLQLLISYKKLVFYKSSMISMEFTFVRLKEKRILEVAKTIN
jgi:hypothetical protein